MKSPTGTATNEYLETLTRDAEEAVAFQVERLIELRVVTRNAEGLDAMADLAVKLIVNECVTRAQDDADLVPVRSKPRLNGLALADRAIQAAANAFKSGKAASLASKLEWTSGKHHPA